MAGARRPISNHAPIAVGVGVAVAVAVYVTAYVAAPSTRPRLATVDGIIEITTALVLLGGAIVGTIGMLGSSARRIYWLIPVVGVLGFLDELRFGAAIFDFSPPSAYGVEVNSFHDVFEVIELLANDLGVSRGQIAVVIGALALGGVVVLIRGRRWARIPDWCSAHRPLAVMVGALGLIIVGIAIDQLQETPNMVFAEETFEFAAAGLVAVAATDVLCCTDPDG